MQLASGRRVLKVGQGFRLWMPRSDFATESFGQNREHDKQPLVALNGVAHDGVVLQHAVDALIQSNEPNGVGLCRDGGLLFAN
jgi:hypothetical protein